MAGIFRKLIGIFRKRKTRVIVVPASLMTVAKWRGVPDLVQSAKGVLYTETCRAMLDCCRNQMVLAITPDGAPDEYNRAIGQALAQGYAACLSDLESMGVYKVPETPLLETFEPAEDLEPTVA